MAKSVPIEVTEKYIQMYYQERYPVDEAKQPHFWEAVKWLAADIDTDVSKLIDEEKDYCVRANSDNFYHIRSLEPGISNTVELARKIAKEIQEVESRPVSPAEVFLLTKRVELLEEKVHQLSGKNNFF